MPEAQLVYPGSIRLVPLDGYDTDSFSKAVVWSRLGTNASVDDVVDYFDERLTSMGWSRGAGTTILGLVAELQVCA